MPAHVSITVQTNASTCINKSAEECQHMYQ